MTTIVTRSGKGSALTHVELDANFTNLNTAKTEEYFIIQNATYTLTSTTATQKLFNVTTNGAFAVLADSTYWFECQMNLSSMSATSGNLKFDVLGAGTATLTNASWSAVGLDSSTIGTAAANGGSFTAASASSGNIVTAGTGTGLIANITGVIRINTAGTIIPSVGLTTAAAAVVGTNTWFRIRKIGSGSVTSLGSWS